MDWTADYIEGACDHCNQHGRVIFSVDPYGAEVHHETAESWWCRPCYDKRAAEI
jgi:hypothetical protein